MLSYGVGTLLGLLILAAAIPYVARIRHSGQKALAAYLIFMTVFVASALLLYGILYRLAGSLDLAPRLDEAGPALLLLVLVFLPAFALASWQARKPPWRQGPPP
jgi:hypothetical protein